MKKALFVLFAIAGSQSASAGMVYYLDLVNTASVNVVSFEVAEPGSTRFHSVIDKVLEGNGASATVAIRIGDGGCRRDMRIGFADGRVEMLAPNTYSLTDYREADLVKRLSGGNPGYRLGGEISWQHQYIGRAGYEVNGATGSGPTVGLGLATGRLRIDFAQFLTDAGTGSEKPTFLSLRYVF